MSKIWGISSRRISLLCSQGRVPGAEKKGKTWLIPKNAVKPTDPRKKNRWRIGDYNAYGKTRTLVYFKDKICEIKNKLVKAIFYYITVIMLVLDPIYLCLLSGAFGGGDVNGILYLMPQAWIWTIFAFILLFNNCSKNSLTSIGTPLKNCFFILYTVSQSWLMYFILC